MFAAFPGWYATMFSALYLALLLVLVALMARGVAFEFREQEREPALAIDVDVGTTIGSLLIPLLLGVGLGDLLVGLPIDSSHEFTGNFFDLLTPYGLWTGLTLRRAVPAARRDVPGAQDDRSTCASAPAPSARPLGWVAIALVVGWVIWTRSVAGGARCARARRDPRGDRGGLRGAAGDDRPRRLGLHRLGDRDRRDRRLDLHRPVSERDGLEHQRRLQPDRQQRGLRLTTR